MKTLPLLLLVTFLLEAIASGAIGIFGQSFYQRKEESPFYRLNFEFHRMSEFYLEDFEDHLFNTPYVTSTTNYEYPYGVLSMQNIRNLGQWGPAQSVDGDDGVIDGHGLLGDSWWGQVSIHFAPNAEGRYPNYAGLVITQGDNISPLPFEVPAYDFYGPNDELIYTLSLQANSFGSDGVQGIDTLADRFIGLYNSDGISRMTPRPTFAVQIDHVQYGWSIPEPGTATLASLAAVLHLWRRRYSP